MSSGVGVLGLLFCHACQSVADLHQRAGQRVGITCGARRKLICVVLTKPRQAQHHVLADDVGDKCTDGHESCPACIAVASASRVHAEAPDHVQHHRHCRGHRHDHEVPVSDVPEFVCDYRTDLSFIAYIEQASRHHHTCVARIVAEGEGVGIAIFDYSETWHGYVILSTEIA